MEDSPRDAEVIRHKLDAEGVSCDIILVSTKDGFEAALTREPFDLILSDYNLPGYDGVSALTYAQQARPDVPVILISGTVGDEEAVRCLHLGATDYLLKDRLERLAPAVERAIQEAETRRTRRLTEEKLRQSELLNRSLVEHLPQRMFVKDLNSNYVFCNSIYARDLGIEPTQIVGKDDFAFFSRELAEGYRADDRQVMTDGKIKVLDERYTVAGEERWIHTVKVPYRDEQGRSSACWGYSRTFPSASGWKRSASGWPLSLTPARISLATPIRKPRRSSTSIVADGRCAELGKTRTSGRSRLATCTRRG